MSEQIRKIAGKFVIWSFCFLLAASSGCSAISLGLVPTDTPTPTDTAIPTLTNTPKPTSTSTLAPTPNATATHQFVAFLELVDKYFNNGWLSSNSGQYQVLDDISLDLAKAGNFKWVSTGITGNHYVVSTSVTMERDGPINNFSGCGLVYAHSDMYFLGQDGYAYRVVGNTVFGKKFFGTVTNPAERQLTLIVNDTASYFLVNGKSILSESVKGISGVDYSGDWGPAVISGTGEGNGVSCEFTNIEYWEADTP